jgi:23S rRNA (guanine745-N1)-methyltransferase
MWQCPLCKLPLQTHQVDAPERLLKTWSCENNHSFDKAKQGYVNLLPVQNKRSKMPGDDIEMVAARTTFFARKPYAPLVRRLAELINSMDAHNTDGVFAPHNPFDVANTPVNIYDSGCGEGYYLEALSMLLSNTELAYKSVQYSFSGHDISKPAVVAAAKRNQDKQLVVASTINIPVLDRSQDIILQVFAPACAAQYARVLHSNGVVITVDPAPKHLFELKKLIYEKPERHQKHHAVLSGFEIREQHYLDFSVALNSAEIRLALLQMTPFFWKTNEKQRSLIQQNLTKVTADFIITIWQQSKELKTAHGSTAAVSAKVAYNIDDNSLQAESIYKEKER